MFPLPDGRGPNTFINDPTSPTTLSSDNGVVFCLVFYSTVQGLLLRRLRDPDILFPNGTRDGSPTSPSLPTRDPNESVVSDPDGTPPTESGGPLRVLTTSPLFLVEVLLSRRRGCREVGSVGSVVVSSSKIVVESGEIP